MKKIKPDDYFNNGIFEMASFGEICQMRNLLNKNQLDAIINKIIDNYENFKEEINNLILEIKETVLQSNPLYFG